ncbi:MAG: UvrD-helicase domain-containing protein [Sedimentisphaerales bacterium]
MQEQTKRAKTGFFYQEDKYETAKRKRKEHTDAVVNSSSNKKIVVAGPGTGKTHLFESILKGKSNALTLTFVNALVEDLSLEFCGLSKVKTLHSFALEIMNEATEGDVKVFPRLTEIISKDAKILLKEEIDFEHLFYNKTAEQKHIDFYKGRKKYYGGYYGFSDIMFAAVRLLEEKKDKIPMFDHVLVDEFQDFNKAEVALIDLLAEKSPVLLVGDDDQALYEFKSASPEHIRQRYNENASGYTKFYLPYCSRCTQVIVESANDIIAAAKKNGHLGNRINKPFKYFDEPDKDKVSEENPQITYKQLQASQIPFHIQIDIEQIAKKVKKEFRVLIICPTNVQCRTVANALKKKGFVNVNFMEKDDKKELMLLDGLKLLLKENNCNLGWRIIAEKLLNDNEFEALLEQTNEDGAARIFDIIKKGLRKEIGQILKILRAVRDGKQTEDEPELAELLKRVNIDAYGMARGELKDEIKPYNPSVPKVSFCEPEVKKIPITITTIQSSKGLDADYVFITYFDDQYFIRNEDKSKITDQDICNFLVALTRARNKVFLISSNPNKKPIFLKWIENKRILEL